MNKLTLLAACAATVFMAGCGVTVTPDPDPVPVYRPYSPVIVPIVRPYRPMYWPGRHHYRHHVRPHHRHHMRPHHMRPGVRHHRPAHRTPGHRQRGPGHHRRADTEIVRADMYNLVSYDQRHLAGHPSHRHHGPSYRHVPVVVPAQPVYNNPFAVPADNGPPGIVECVFNNTTDSDARVTVKVTYFASRGPLTPIMRVKRNYITIRANSSRLASFTMFPSSQYSSHEVIVDRGNVTYDCRFGRR